MENLRLAAGHLDGILDGIDKAQLIAVALACMVEVGAVVHAGADDGQAQRDIDERTMASATTSVSVW